MELVVLDALGYTRVGGATPNLPPAILSSAFVTPTPVQAGVKATFMVAATDPNGDLVNVAWNFGNGVWGNGPICDYVYPAGGDFTVTAVVSDGFGGSVTSSFPLTVSAASFTTVEIIKQKFTLNFKTGKDAIDVAMFSSKFDSTADGSVIKFIIGNAEKGTVVDMGTLAKGKAAGAVGKFTVNVKKNTVEYATTKAALATLLAPYGATNDDISKSEQQTVPVPVFVFYNGAYYGATITFDYSAKAGKSGSGK